MATTCFLEPRSTCNHWLRFVSKGDQPPAPSFAGVTKVNRVTDGRKKRKEEEQKNGCEPLRKKHHQKCLQLTAVSFMFMYHFFKRRPLQSGGNSLTTWLASFVLLISIYRHPFHFMTLRTLLVGYSKFRQLPYL